MSFFYAKLDDGHSDPNVMTSRDLEADRNLVKAGGGQLLAQTLDRFASHKDSLADAETCAQMIVVLLDSQADPNHTLTIDDRTPWKMVLDQAISHTSAHGEFLRSFDMHGYGQVFSKMVVVFVLAGADVNATRVYRQKRYRDTKDPMIFRRSALYILETLFMQTKWEEKGRSAEDIAAMNSFRERLTGLMTDKGAKAREWWDTKLIAGPPENEKSLTPGHSDDDRSSYNRSPVSEDGRSRRRDKLRRFFGSKSSSKTSDASCQPVQATTRDDITLMVNDMRV